MTVSHGVVIVGAGQAAAQACASLRQFGFDGPITLIGEETALPYQRPPLSKGYMKGELSDDRLYFRPKEWYTENNVTVRLGCAVHRIDPGRKSVMLSDGSSVPFDQLILATGSRPRPMPPAWGQGGGVFDLRSIADVHKIRPQMGAGRRLVIIGAGYIGLEAAAVARQLGLEVTVLERASRVLERVAGTTISTYFGELHRARGVDIITSAEVSELQYADGNVSGVRLGDGSVVSCDVVLVGIGILPNAELAADAGLQVDNGIVVDLDAKTSHADIYAAGDCTVRPLVPYGGMGRLESVHNAIEQGKAAAAAIAGKPRPAMDCPWFWSDQYDTKLQIAGLSAGYDAQIVRGNPGDGKFAVFYFKGDTLIAADAVNSPPEFMMAKKMVLAEAAPDRAALADPSQSIKDITQAAIAGV